MRLPQRHNDRCDAQWSTGNANIRGLEQSGNEKEGQISGRLFLHVKFGREGECGQEKCEVSSAWGGRGVPSARANICDDVFPLTADAMCVSALNGWDWIEVQLDLSQYDAQQSFILPDLKEVGLMFLLKSVGVMS